jgi:signal transduction histidine kinase/ActR/RegA family two-component response regulator
MRFRTKLFFGWVALTLVLWGGAFFAIRRSVEQSFNRMADETFYGIHHRLQRLFAERVSTMRQACELIVNIPELRALIADQNYELAAENQDSLRERLDYLNDMVGATFLCALNDDAQPLAVNRTSPWRSPSRLIEFIQQSGDARSLLTDAFQMRGEGKFGLWIYEGRLYQVVAVPIVFQSGEPPGMQRPDGAILMGNQVTDAISTELGKSHGCEVSFLAQGQVVATSLNAPLAHELLIRSNVEMQPSIIELRGMSYRVAFDPLVDPSSGQTVGNVVIQQNQANARTFLWEVWGKLFLTIVGGTIAAALASFLLSLAITRPVQSLVTGVREVARGNLDVTIRVSGQDELAELAGAFNDMVGRIRQSHSELERLLDEAREGAQRERALHEQLRKAYSELRANQQQTIQTERLRALGQMASGIAHDFNNHLTSILAFLEMSLDRTDLSDELRRWLQMSHESSLAAADVVKLLRNFYRRDTSDTLQPVDLNKLVDATISLTRPRWFDMPRRQGTVVHLREDLAPVGHVLGNASELRDALTNLIFNGVDAMPGGGDITVRTRRDGEWVTIEVEDTGSGMTDEVRTKCLEPYFTTKGAQGTGLGLSMVLAIAERHRGSLAIESCLGRGTTIRLTLPPADVSQEASAETRLERVNGSKRILCVDDDSRVLSSLDGLLRQLGHVVSTTSSPHDAIQRVASREFDVIITDLGMPVIDGRQVARSSKQLAPKTRVLLLTGWADRLRIEGDVPEGVDQLLGKPVTKAQLQQAIDGVAIAPAPVLDAALSTLAPTASESTMD